MTAQAQTLDYSDARRAMVENQLRPQGVTDQGVLSAMMSVPREHFVPLDVRPLAYVDRSIAIGDGRYMPAPAVLGQLLTQMAPEHGDKALVVGGGGYSAAVLAAIGCEVTALEALAAPDTAPDRIHWVQGPLDAGHAARAPYDLILLDGAVEYIPDAFIKQLADGGRLGTALVDRGITRLIVGRKMGEAFGYLSVGDAGVARLPGFSRPREFNF